jgi:hypothetical protein
MPRFSLVFHATESHGDPRVKLVKALATGKEACGEVARGASDNSIKFHDDLGFEVLFARGQFADFVFELPHRFRSHAARARREIKSQEGIAFSIGNNLRLGWAQV